MLALLADPAHRASQGRAAQARARTHFSAAAIVPRYEALYRRVGGSQSTGYFQSAT